MRKRLAAFHTNFAYFEKTGAGHWWGNECVDWPPLFDFLKRNVRPNGLQPPFVTLSPAVSEGSRDGVRILQQERALAPSTLRVARPQADGALRVTTENVRRLSVPKALSAAGLVLDDQEVADADAETFLRTDGRWTASESPLMAVSEKSPWFGGPFKDAFRDGVIFIHGTRGTPEENAWALAKARYDAEQLAYRGNAAVRIVPDDHLWATLPPVTNLVLYGHRDMNSAWAWLGPDCPVDVRRGEVTIGTKRFEGDDLACLFCHPSIPYRSLSEYPSGVGIAVVAGTGPVGMRLTESMPYFTSGIAYPDWCVVRADLLEKGLEGFRAAGFFQCDWSLGDDAAYR
jgi:hypothetical protein